LSILVKFASITEANISRSFLIMAKTLGTLNRRTIALLWLVIASVVIGLFIYFEQIAILYVIATLGIVLLLLIVAFADLENVGRETLEESLRK